MELLSTVNYHDNYQGTKGFFFTTTHITFINCKRFITIIAITIAIYSFCLSLFIHLNKNQENIFVISYFF